MPYPHTIRLHGPWEYEPLARTVVLPDGTRAIEPGELPAAGRMRIPGDWGSSLGQEFRGRVCFRRGFNCPTKLDRQEHVWLVCEGVDPRGSLTLNGQWLGEARGYALAAEFDVTALLAPRNELQIEVDLPRLAESAPQFLRPGREHLPGGLIGEIRLEIRKMHFIERLSLSFDQTGAQVQTVLQGVVQGEPCDELFEVVATGPGGELIYAEVPVGRAFDLRGPTEGIPAWQCGTIDAGTARLAEIEVRLLHGGSRLWETWLHTALPMAIDRRTEFIPFNTLPDKRNEFRSTATVPPLLLDQIDERRLAECDLAGIPVIQSIPQPWAAELCPRLAFHPCIAAWGCTEEEHGSEGSPGCFGRPWVVVPEFATAAAPG